MKIVVDMNLCESHGQCVFAAPGVFSFDDADTLVYEPNPDDASREAVGRAAALCPVRAITVSPAAP
ncbi:ferredoxin [Streptomyces alkaliphilus]|uniref:Ferredoxin n=1 Tax=Streptomyces alkaliphilus TaxID=1472722 RepID=A0A7W3TIC3_9ACTN|nr:ferredoxin [Streptomyces alkaliphilus]MBB0247353.1 ferredoxin [Streptomyces alkaliphilus]